MAMSGHTKFFEAARHDFKFIFQALVKLTEEALAQHWTAETYNARAVCLIAALKNQRESHLGMAEIQDNINN